MEEPPYSFTGWSATWCNFNQKAPIMKKSDKRAAAISAVALTVIIVVLVRPPGVDDRSSPEPTTTDFAAVASEQFGEQQWPFTVDSGRVDCLPGSVAVFKSDSVVYALNGLATSAGYEDIGPIWKDDPAELSPKINIGPLLDAALDLCD